LILDIIFVFYNVCHIYTYALWFLIQSTPVSDDSHTDDSSTISQKHLEQVHDMVADAMLDLSPAPNIKGLLEFVF